MNDKVIEKLIPYITFSGALLELIVIFYNIIKNKTIHIYNVITLITVLLLIFSFIIIFIKYKNIKQNKTKEYIELNKKYNDAISLLNNTTNDDRSLINVVRYVMYSMSRENYNNFTLDLVSIVYEIKDNISTSDCLDMIITYYFQGKNDSDKDISSMFIYSAINFDDKVRNIKANAKDCRDNKGTSFTPGCKYIEDKNVISWSLPFEHNSVKMGDIIKYEFKLEWKKFFNVNPYSEVIIDPKNYSINTEKIEIKVINTSHIEFNSIHIYEYCRSPFGKKNTLVMTQCEEQKWKQDIINIVGDKIYILYFI